MILLTVCKSQYLVIIPGDILSHDNSCFMSPATSHQSPVLGGSLLAVITICQRHTPIKFLPISI